MEPDPQRDETAEDAPSGITWFALGHVAVLLYLALHALKL